MFLEVNNEQWTSYIELLDELLINLNLCLGFVLLNGPGFVNKIFTAVFNQLFDGEEGWKEFHDLTTYGGTVTEKLIILNG